MGRIQSLFDASNVVMSSLSRQRKNVNSGRSVGLTMCRSQLNSVYLLRALTGEYTDLRGRSPASSGHRSTRAGGSFCLFLQAPELMCCSKALPVRRASKGQQGRRPRPLVDGKQLAAVLRIKPLWRLHRCALLVFCWGGAGASGSVAALDSRRASKR